MPQLVEVDAARLVTFVRSFTTMETFVRSIATAIPLDVTAHPTLDTDESLIDRIRDEAEAESRTWTIDD